MGISRRIKFTSMKLLKSILPVLAVAEWEQPTYFEALAMAKQRNGDWGFPVGIKAAADWQNCGTPTTAQGFDAGDELECSSATCMLKCPAGQYAIGRRRIRCRWKRKHGFFWKSQLGNCQGCEPTDPTTSLTDANISASCSVNHKGKHICMMSCPTGMSLLGKNRQKMKCKCPRQSNGQRTCGWILRKSFIDAAGLGGLACTGTAVSGGGGVAASPATNASVATNAPVAATTVASGAGGGNGAGLSGTTAASNNGGATAGNGAGTAAPAAGGTTAAPAGTTAAPAGTTAAPAATTAAADQKAACLAAITGNADADSICDELVRVNVYRAEHGANPLTINPTLCQSAQAKAAQLAAQTGGTCRIDHDVANLQSVNQGENLYSGTGTGCMAKTPAQHMEIASKMWQHEIQDFNMAGCVDNNCNEVANCDGGADGLKPFGCGHFTQQIWASTTSMCYAFAAGTDGCEYVVARYDPPGNTNTLYDDNLGQSTCGASCSSTDYQLIGCTCPNTQDCLNGGTGRKKRSIFGI